MRLDRLKVILRSSTLASHYIVRPETVLESNRKSTRTVRHANYVEPSSTTQISETPRPTRTHAPTMGNSASPGLGSGTNHGLRDVRLTDPDKEEESPPASPEPNRKSQETNRKSQEPNRKPHEQLPVHQNPYNSAQLRGREVHVPTCANSTTIQRGAWKSENSLYDLPSSNLNSNKGVRPEVRLEVLSRRRRLPSMSKSALPECCVVAIIQFVSPCRCEYASLLRAI